ncbi:MAG TPA: hypothetical protein VL309_07560 [Vicinamibacterales bacterium]|jgi:hypothetical protein|nr:hypothetical protein [Vicinamibacterales bacterium]
MELLLGAHVREHGSRIGRLAGFELVPTTLAIRRILFSPDGDLGPQTAARPVAGIGLVHDDGEIELRGDVASEPMPVANDVLLLTRATRLRQKTRERGRFAGIEVNPADGMLVSVFGRLHWWSRRFSADVKSADFTTPGEIQLAASGSQAA